MASLLVDDITLVTADALAGEKLQEFALEFPAATATKTPAFARLLTAAFTLVEKPPPSDMFATAGLMWFVRTQSTPAMIPLQVPEPEQFRTRTPRSNAPLATPYVLPPTVPATCVP